MPVKFALEEGSQFDLKLAFAFVELECSGKISPTEAASGK